MINNTKIICTIGPASNDLSIIKKMIISGMDAARLNFSHSDHDSHLKAIMNIRKAEQLTKTIIPIIQDLQGPKIRIGELKDKQIFLKSGNTVVINSKPIKGDSDKISTTYNNFTKDVQRGDIILIDDGRIQLKVQKKKDDQLICIVQKGGVVTEHKGINLPNSSLEFRSLTFKDMKDLRFGVKHGVDFIALSFVRKKQDILHLKAELFKLGKDIPIIAKIEKPEAIKNIDEIISVSDAIMVARGDMGIEISPEDVPVIQKNIIIKCNEQNKPVITATQMLESMITSYIPTRAEASDVANSVLDGTDCVMLSGETSIGIDPVNVIETMSKIIDKTELVREPVFMKRINQEQVYKNDLDIICRSAMMLAYRLNAKAIITLTMTGRSPNYLSSHRVNTDIVAVTSDEKLSKKCSLIWGVHIIKVDKGTDNEEMIDIAINYCKKNKIAQKHDKIIILENSKRTKDDSANTIRVFTI